MGNRKYRKSADHRQQPSSQVPQNSLPTRTARRQAGKKAIHENGRDAGVKHGGRLLSVLFFVFIFLPVFAVFLYVAVIYTPEEENLISASSSEVRFQENTSPITPLVIEEESEEAEEAEAPAAEEEPIPEPEPESAEPERTAPEQPAAEQPAAEEEQEEESEQETYVVKKGDTLYRIAVEHYGSGTAVDKIMEANGLASPDLSIGDTLVLP
ncbi:LysM peptidoglycan-binding domain-containing protein [Indiicoccus explosivorum]|uniref:LysM peptidoglycan-binding domain-containing protein n=1 Tax=Indiicoccus explosivorum TaxID=1917864 RepID=UPI000B4450C5|nr:LysM peptidoglycan-binding domain-containing protein [Indiicoccus explosivorum]